MAPRRPSRRRRRWALPVAAALVVLLAAGTVRVATMVTSTSPATGCLTSDGALTYRLSLDQARIATTVAAVGRRLGMPDHAVTVALATGLRESNLRNLDHGDRDSVGVFQQRPSQGWGARASLLLPEFSAAAFFRALTTVDGWQTMSVGQAAQAVQRSAVPRGYAPYEREGRALARALTGETPGALACRVPSSRRSARVELLAGGLRRELGTNPIGTAPAAATGWTAATWVETRAGDLALRTISFDGRRWDTATGTWRPDPAAGPNLEVA